jgi:putative tryptophan/tyrosine transport system substrate-binding protein
LVTSLNRPDGNLTGVVHALNTLGPKLLELLREILPHGASVAVLINPLFGANARYAKDLHTAAGAVGQQLQIIKASNEVEIDDAFDAIQKSNAGALLVASEPFFLDQRQRIVALASRYAVPAIYPGRLFVEAGGLMSYATDVSDSFREAGHYTGRILKGVHVTDLPIIQAVKFELILNQKTANTLGFAFPSSLLARADEVIE